MNRKPTLTHHIPYTTHQHHTMNLNPLTNTNTGVPCPSVHISAQAIVTQHGQQDMSTSAAFPCPPLPPTPVDQCPHAGLGPIRCCCETLCRQGQKRHSAHTVGIVTSVYKQGYGVGSGNQSVRGTQLTGSSMHRPVQVPPYGERHPLPPHPPPPCNGP